MKFLNKQDPSTRKWLMEAMEKLLLTPPKGDIKRMKGAAGIYRLRVGTYRVIFEKDLKEKVIYIRLIGNRGDIYK